jgi:DNA (cytosine-5)-methyltransferase 1
MLTVDIFCGCGGMSEGLRQAGFESVLMVDYCRKCIETVNLNGFKNSLCSKVENVDFSKFRNKVDLLCGGPPCQPFSFAGKRMGETDERDGWMDAVRCVEAMMPKSFLFENVTGLLSDKFKTYFEKVLSLLKKTGYKVQVFKVDCSHYGVPQRRKRVLLIGFLDKDAHDRFVPPETVFKSVSVREALASLGEPSDEREDGHTLHKRKAKVYQHRNGSDPDLPSKTVMAGVPGGVNTMRLEDGTVRYYTIREACRVQTFPDSYSFPHCWSRNFKQIGNAVPPLLAKVWGESIKNALTQSTSSFSQEED